MLMVNEKWIVACSGGPDSMALLDQMKDKNIIVAHVNYHKRPTADRDMKIVEDYCEKYNIPCFVLNEAYEVTGNFQAFARDYRYAFFKRIAEETSACGVLLAHQEDDLLETYLMQVDKHLVPDYYGLKEQTVIKGVCCRRPLLHKTKKELQEYCLVHGVPFGIDESNLSDDYTRNRIRHTCIEKMDSNERIRLREEIDAKNSTLMDQRNRVKDAAEVVVLDLKKYRMYEVEDRLTLLRLYFRFNQVVEMDHASRRQLVEIDRVLMNKRNYQIPFGDKSLNISYDSCEIVGNQDKSYSFVIESLHSFETEFFKVGFEGKSVEAVTVSADDFPLTIRSPRENDRIEMRFGHKAINRFFIDRKISMKDRLTWPVVVNRDNEIILVPGLGCNVSHYSVKPNLFVIK